MPGITRIHIESDWSRSDDWRLQVAAAHENLANDVYRRAFERIDMALDEGEEVVSVTMQEAKARYDWEQGVDIILQSGGARMTLQEKILTFNKSTATFEERKTSGAPGFWYYGTPQYYFVGYSRQYWDWRNRVVYENPVVAFQDWALIDFPRIRRCDAAGQIEWEYKENQFDGRRATFRFIYFDGLPEECLVARYQTKAPCIRCGRQVYATNPLDQRLMNGFPKDGQWMCSSCQQNGQLSLFER